MKRRTVSLGVYILACILSRHCLITSDKFISGGRVSVERVSMFL
jgi:hypothetical protein